MNTNEHRVWLLLFNAGTIVSVFFKNKNITRRISFRYA